MRRALRLAERGRYRVSPNPMVGAVVMSGATVVGEGYHRAVGGPHAEVEALAQAGRRARGATLYVTLEPCVHQGRTPPCVEAILAAGIREVVACHRDPDPRVDGRGFARLRRAGVRVNVGILAADAVALNAPFLTAIVKRRPWVTLKWAMSLDGKIATAAGESRWISSEPARAWALGLREEHDAIVAGIRTLLADDPLLNRRLGRAKGPNVRVILDRRLRLPRRARLFGVEGEVRVYTESQDRRRRVALERAGARVVVLRQVTPRMVLRDLFREGIRSVLVEGGGQVLAAFVKERVFDRVAIACSPLLVGGDGAPGPLRGAGASRLAAAPRIDGLSVRRLGADWILNGYRSRCLPDLLQSAGG